jgi:hypothetical protein
MRFDERQYQLITILGNSEGQPLCTRQQWSAIEPALLAVLKLIQGPKSMQSLQYDGDKPIAFGRLGLNAASLEKWIHDENQYPDRQQWLFHSNELWAPGRTACERLDLPPDLYFGFRNEGFYKPQSPSPYIVLASALDRGSDFNAAAKELATALISVTQAIQHSSRRTTWGQAIGSGAFTNAIGDLLSGGAQF